MSSDNSSEVEDDAGGENENNAGRKVEDDAGGEDKDDNGGKSGEDNGESEDEDDASKEVKDDACGKDEDDAGGEGKDDDSRKGEDNDGGEGEDNVGANNEILNRKLRVGNADKTSNLGEIAVGKLAFGYITNPLVDTLASSTIAPYHQDDTSKNGDTLNRKLRVGNADEILNLGEIVASKLTFGCIANPLVDTPALGIVAPHHLIVSILGWPALPPFGSSIVSLIGLYTFLHDLFLAFLINGGTIKLLAEVITNLFSNNLSTIAHPPHDGCTSKQTPSRSLGVGVANLSLGVNVTFDTWSQCSSCFGSIISAVDWRQQVCDYFDKGFLERMYLLGCVKFL